MKKRTVWIAGGVAATLVAGALVVASIPKPDAGRFEQALDGDCAPLVVLAFRGSGEGNLTPGVTSNAGAPYRYGDSNLVTNGWEGVTLDGLFEALSTTEYEGFRADRIPVVPIGPAGDSEPFGYDAIDAITEATSVESALTYSNSRLLYSAARGAEAATYLIQDYLERSEGCPVAPVFVAVGYSQGAMAARHTAELNPDSVIATLKIGDPYQKPRARGVRDAGADGVGIIRWKANDTQRKQLDAYYNSLELTSSICHDSDPICEFEPVSGLFKLATGMYGEHLDYYSDAYPDEARDDALAIARLAYERWMLALAARDAGTSVSWSQTSGDAPTPVRTLSMSIAGTPTLFSALSPELIGRDVRFEFDLDGDGTFETLSTDGTVWVTFDDDRPRTIGLRVSYPDGSSSQSTARVEPAPALDSEIVFTSDGTLVEPQLAGEPEPQPTPQRPAPRPAPAPAAPAPAPPVPAPAPEPSPAPAPAPTPAPEPEPTPTPAPPPPVEPPVEEPPAEEPPIEEPPVEEPPVEEPPAEEPGVDAPETDGPRVDFGTTPIEPGSSVVVVGVGFTPDSSVRFEISGLLIDAPVRTTSLGHFRFEFAIPSGTTAGEYFGRVFEASSDSEPVLTFLLPVVDPT